MITQLIAGACDGDIASRLRVAAGSGPREIVVRLEARDANAETLVALRDAAFVLGRAGGRLVIVASDPSVRRLLAVTFLDRSFDVRSCRTSWAGRLPSRRRGRARAGRAWRAHLRPAVPDTLQLV